MVGASDMLLPVDIPSFGELIRLIKQTNPQAHIITVKKMDFPTNMLLPTVRKVSVLLSKIGFFNIFPYGYCITVKFKTKRQNDSMGSPDFHR